MNLQDLKGGWALVTGASAGIGREFAVQLAQQGVNVALVARRRDVLDALALELSTQHGVQAMAMPLDLSRPDAAQSVLDELARRRIPLQLLVNNAALGRWGRFEATDAASYQDMVAVNALSTMALCRALLPELATRRPSAVVNLSSPAAFQPVPYMAVYAASKAFLHSLSLALHEEWRERGVYVQTLVPGPTATEFDQKAGAYASALGAQRAAPGQVVLKSLAAFGAESPLVLAASGTLMQRLFSAVAPTSMMLRKVGEMFRPPDVTR